MVTQIDFGQEGSACDSNFSDGIRPIIANEIEYSKVRKVTQVRVPLFTSVTVTVAMTVTGAINACPCRGRTSLR